MRYEVEIDALVCAADHSYRARFSRIVYNAENEQQVRDWVRRVYGSAEVLSIKEVS